MVIFVLSSLLAIYMAGILRQAEGIQTPGPTTGIFTVFIYLALAIVFTFVVLYLSKKKKLKIIRGLFIFLVVYVIFYVFLILGAVIAQTYLQYYIIIIAVPLLYLYLLIYRNEWYVVDSAGFFMSAGLSAVWGVLVGVWAAVALLVVFAIYDYIAVYRTKHMVSLAKVAIDESLPLLFVVPSEKGVKMSDLTFDGREGKKVLMLGFGDIALPSILVVSSALYGNNLLMFTLLPMLGALIGMFILFFVNANRPAPGLPFINTGVIIGFLIAFFFF